MKTLKYVFLSIVLIVCSCEAFLDRYPLDSMSESAFFLSRRDLAAWNAGIYVALQDALSNGHYEWGDVRSDLYGSTGNSYVPVRQYTNTLDASQGEFNWANLYTVITRCNTAIEKYPTIPDLEEADYSDYMGQAHGLRALMYFYAIRTWGDVPKVDKSWDGSLSGAQIPRSPISEIKTLILSDIDDALRLLNVGLMGERKYAFNRAAAYALKTDVHLWFGEDQDALDASEWFFMGDNVDNYRLISNMDDYRTIFIDPLASSETIFTLFWDTGESGVNCDWCGRYGSKGGNGVSVNNGLRISQRLFNDFVIRIRSPFGTDARFVANYDTVGMYNSVGTPGNRPAIDFGHYNTSGTAAQSFLNKNIKYSPRPTTSIPATGGWYTVLPLSVEEGSADGRCQILFPIYRLADVYLLRAEALNRLGRGTDALELVNDIRRRVGYMRNANMEADGSDKDAVEQVILHERKLEFIAEGRRWYDLRRWGDSKLIEYMDEIIKERQIELGQQETGFDHPGRVLAPIHSSEFERNPALVQNPPYAGIE